MQRHRAGLERELAEQLRVLHVLRVVPEHERERRHAAEYLTSSTWATTIVAMIANKTTRLLDIAQAARRLHVSPDTVRRRIRSGELQAYRVGANGNVRIAVDSVDALLVPYTTRGDTT
jgi:excisionase family DNA binding protein